MGKLSLFCWVALGLMVARGFAAPAQDSDATLENLFRKSLDDTLRLRPLEATRLGDHRYDAFLENLTAPSRAVWLDQTRRTLADLPTRVPYQSLSRNSQVNYEIWQHHLAFEIWREENLHPYDEDPLLYEEYLFDSVRLLLTDSPLPLETNVANCLSRMSVLNRVVAAARANLRNPSRLATETAIQQNRAAIEFYQHEILARAGRTRQLPALNEAAARAAAQLREYQRFLETDLLPRSNSDWRAGPDHFGRIIDQELGAGLTADQLNANAEAEFSRVSRQVYEYSRHLWPLYYPGFPLPPDDEPGRLTTIQDVLQGISRQRTPPDSIRSLLMSRVASQRQFIRQDRFLTIGPSDRLQEALAPEIDRGGAVLLLSQSPPLENKHSLKLSISPPPRSWDSNHVTIFMAANNTTVLELLSMREAYPGMAAQAEAAFNQKSLIRLVLASKAYKEGWVDYSTGEMLDEGYKSSDLPLKFEQLRWYLQSIGHALIDHRLHCGATTDNEALDFLTRQCFEPPAEATQSILRAKLYPGVSSAAFAGRAAFYQLRQDIARQLGNKFQLGAFHNALLSTGPVPVRYLPELAKLALGLEQRSEGRGPRGPR